MLNFWNHVWISPNYTFYFMGLFGFVENKQNKTKGNWEKRQKVLILWVMEYE